MDQTNLDFFEAAASGDFAKLCAQVSKGANVKDIGVNQFLSFI